MKGGYGQNEDLCPECGHLLTRKSTDCQFCGWSVHEPHMSKSDMDNKVVYSDLDDRSIFTSKLSSS